jgi:hypothetical protein
MFEEDDDYSVRQLTQRILQNPSRPTQTKEVQQAQGSQKQPTRDFPRFLTANGQKYQLVEASPLSGSNQMWAPIRSRSPSPTGKGNLLCFACKEPGHYASRCPNKTAGRASSPVGTTSFNRNGPNPAVGVKAQVRYRTAIAN